MKKIMSNEINNEMEELVLRDLYALDAGEDAEPIGKLLTYNVSTAEDVDALVDSNYFGSTSGTRWNGINLITQKQCVTRGWYLVMLDGKRPVRYNKLSDVKKFFIVGDNASTIDSSKIDPRLMLGDEYVDNWIEYSGSAITLSVEPESEDGVVIEWKSSDPEVFSVSEGTISAKDTSNKIGKVDIIANVDKTELIANIVFIDEGITLTKDENSNTVKLSDYTVIGGRINSRSIRYEWFSEDNPNKPINTTDTYDKAGIYTVKAYLPFVSSDKKITYEFVVETAEEVEIIEPSTEESGDEVPEGTNP